MAQSIITSHFLSDHQVLERMFSEFEIKGSTDLLNDMKNSLSRHWREEEILYNSYKGKKKDFVSRIRTVLDQHRIMESLLNDFYINREKDKISMLKKLLYEHRNLEEKYVYPEFDIELSDEEKQDIADDLMLYEKKSEKGTPSEHFY